MFSTTQLRALKKQSREINRVPDDTTVNLPGNSILSKAEVEQICVTKESFTYLITQAGSVDYFVDRTTFGGDLVRFSIFSNLAFNNILFHSYNVIARVNYPWLTNLSRAVVTATQVRPVGGKPFAYVVAGTQLAPYNNRVTSLIITYGDILHSGTVEPNKVYVHLQTTITAPSAGIQYYLAQYCTIPEAEWDPTRVKITGAGATRAITDINDILMAMPAEERGMPGGLVVDIPGTTVNTSSTQTTIPVTTIPATTKLIFAAAMRNTEEYEYLNTLYAVSFRDGDN